MKNPQFTIIKIIVQQSLALFKEEVEQFCKEHKVVKKEQGVSIVPIQNAGQMGMLPIPYAIVEFVVTEEEYRIWKFGEQLKS